MEQLAEELRETESENSDQENISETESDYS